MNARYAPRIEGRGQSAGRQNALEGELKAMCTAKMGENDDAGVAPTYELHKDDSFDVQKVTRLVEWLRIVFGLFFSGEGFSECTLILIMSKSWILKNREKQEKQERGVIT